MATPRVIEYLLRLADRHGVEILRHTGTKKYYDPEFKEAAIKRVLQGGEAANAVSIDLGLSNQGMLAGWIRKYIEDGYNVIERKKGRYAKGEDKERTRRRTEEGKRADPAAYHRERILKKIRRLGYGARKARVEEIAAAVTELRQMSREAGFDTVEVTSRETGLFGLETVRSVLDKYDLSAGGYMYMDNLGEPEENVLDAVKTAETLGADVLMLIPYWHASLEGKTRDEIHEVYAKRWQKAAELAEEKGIRTVVEDTPDQRGADIALDGRGMTSARHGSGLIPLKDVADLLKKQGYDGRWVVELSMDGSSDYRDAAAHAYGYMLDLLKG